MTIVNETLISPPEKVRPPPPLSSLPPTAVAPQPTAVVPPVLIHGGQTTKLEDFESEVIFKDSIFFRQTII